MCIVCFYVLLIYCEHIKCLNSYNNINHHLTICPCVVVWYAFLPYFLLSLCFTTFDWVLYLQSIIASHNVHKFNSKKTKWVWETKVIQWKDTWLLFRRHVHCIQEEVGSFIIFQDLCMDRCNCSSGKIQWKIKYK